MFPATPPVQGITRPRLRQIAHWIRDELDPIIAREGPEHLRADDVLILHDIFQALRSSTMITALDLRATGIHRAVMDVSGMATRWPGRLCDDCDKIIGIWTAKFGRLEDLHPFLYGRGGRLEGIATAEDSTKQALIKRWQNTCPEKISPKRSRRHGDLGFRAGDWWINPLFACHAGIICLESVEGGISYDKNGAYAMLLKDTGEIDAPSETNFRYRCGRNDRGRFRLTAATAKSRTPIRVLRSHSINSIWGPKAGVRYEGLYYVVGWSVHQIKTDNISGDEYRVGDIVYDVQLVRDDPVLMEEVVKHPTTCQIDEYTEYKRLRKVYREMQRKGEDGIPETQPLPTKVAPPIAPLMPTIPLSRSQTKFAPNASRTITLKHMNITNADSLLPTSRPPSHQEVFEEEQALHGPPMGMLEVPTQITTRSSTQTSNPESVASDARSHTAAIPALRSTTSSTHSHTSEVREVAPWIDYELEVYERRGSPFFPSEREGITRVSRNSTQSPMPARPTRNSPTPTIYRKSDERMPDSVPVPAAVSAGSKSRETRRSALVRSRNPMAKLFDGAEDAVAAGDDYFTCKRRAASVAPKTTSPLAKQYTRASLSQETPLSPVPIRPMSPNSPLFTERRNAICLPYGYVVSPNTPAIDFHERAVHNATSAYEASKDVSSTHSMLSIPPSLPLSLQSLISRSKPISALTTPASSPHPSTKTGEVGTEDGVAVDRLRRYVEGVDEVKVSFRNPFYKKDGPAGVRRHSSAEVAPHINERDVVKESERMV